MSTNQHPVRPAPSKTSILEGYNLADKPAAVHDQHVGQRNREPATREIGIMGTASASHLITWFFIGGTFLPPPLLLVLVGFSGGQLSQSDVEMIIVALVNCVATGALFGLCIQPRSEFAGLSVLASPLIATLVSFVIIGVYRLCFGHVAISTAIPSIGGMAVVAFLSVPSAGIVRATHWLRDRES